MLLRPGDIIEGQRETYLITATINRGAYGCAFRARAIDGSWRVIKQFEPTEELSPEDFEYQQRCFEREAQILSTVESPRIVRGHELIFRDDEVFFAMEHVQGESLRVLLERLRQATGEPFPAPVVLGIARQICAVIDYLHRLPGQIIYRDLKPSNVMWDAVAGRLKLIDFGTARFNDGAGKATQGLGTEGYAPPELYTSGAQLSPATDVYTIGAVLYELACGQAPPGRATPDHFHGYDDRLPAGFRRAVLRALRQHPGDRPPSAAALLDELLADGALAADPPLQIPPENHHPATACFCPVCLAAPSQPTACYCGHDGAMYQTALLQIVPKHRPATTVYLDRDEVTLGRNNPDAGYYPSIDLTACDPLRHVSRRHATIRRQGATYTVTIHSSANPSRLQGELLQPEQTSALLPGARMELADLVLSLLLKPVLDPPPVAAEVVLP